MTLYSWFQKRQEERDNSSSAMTNNKESFTTNNNFWPIAKVTDSQRNSEVTRIKESASEPKPVSTSLIITPRNS